jgi:hypothetical protein
MGNRSSRIASIHSTPVLPLAAEESPSQHETPLAPVARAHAQPLRPSAGPLVGLSARQELETGPARKVEHAQSPRTGLLNMPAEIIRLVKNNLPPKNIKALANTCRAMGRLLTEEKRSILLSERQIHTPGEVTEVLSGMRNAISEPSLQASTLAALATKIDPSHIARGANATRMILVPRSVVRDWPAHEYVGVFDSVWTAITQLPRQLQGEPLLALAPTLRHLPGGGQHAARSNAFFEQVRQLPEEHQHRLLAVLGRATSSPELARRIEQPPGTPREL